MKLYCQMTVPEKYRHYFGEFSVTYRISDKETLTTPPSCIVVYPDGHVTALFNHRSVTS